MNGPEHFREAERKIRVADNLQGASAANIYASAQVHATLALAAATALNDAVNDSGEGGMPNEDLKVWKSVAGVTSIAKSADGA